MISHINTPKKHQLLILFLLFAVIVNACSTPDSRHSYTSSQNTTENTTTANDSSLSSTATTIRIESQHPGSTVEVTVLDSTPTPNPATVNGELLEISPEAEPVIFTEMAILGNRCGHGDVVAVDGHELLGTPRIKSDDSNFLELLAEGARVDIIDCRVWTDQEDLNWMSIRTAEGKLGWMFVQPDKFLITLYPVSLERPPPALTGIPAFGKRIAYVPPSACFTGEVTDEAQATSLGLGFIPVVGDLKSVGEAIIGCDMVTGQQLGNWRWLGLFGLVGLSEIALVKQGEHVIDGLRVADNLAGSLRYGDESVNIAMRGADNADEFIQGLRRVDHSVEEGSDVMLSLEHAEVLSTEGHALSNSDIQSIARLNQSCGFDNTCPHVLRQNIIESNQTPAGSTNMEWQAHYIIPTQLQDHPFLEGVNTDWFNSVHNGVGLPTLDADASRLGLPPHHISHATYTEYVQDRLNKLNDDAFAENWSADQKANELQNLANELREYILHQQPVQLR